MKLAKIDNFVSCVRLSLRTKQVVYQAGAYLSFCSIR